MKTLNIDKILAFQKYVDARAFAAEFGYDSSAADWNKTALGRIGLQLSCISASIEEIYEIVTNDLKDVDTPQIKF